MPVYIKTERHNAFKNVKNTNLRKMFYKNAFKLGNVRVYSFA